MRGIHPANLVGAHRWVHLILPRSPDPAWTKGCLGQFCNVQEQSINNRQRERAGQNDVPMRFEGGGDRPKLILISTTRGRR